MGLVHRTTRPCEEYHIHEIPTLMVLNKIDAVDPLVWQELKERYGGLLCSAQTGEGLDNLMHTLEQRLFQARQVESAS